MDRVGHGPAAGGEARLTGPGQPEPFTGLARQPDPPLDELALGIAAAFRAVDVPAALAVLDDLGAEVAGTPGSHTGAFLAELVTPAAPTARRAGGKGRAPARTRKKVAAAA